MKPTRLSRASFALAALVAASPALAQPTPAAPLDLSLARCRVSDPVPSAATFGRAPAAAFSRDGSFFALVAAETMALTLYDAATCARRAGTVVASDLPPTARFLDVLVARPGLILLSVNGTLSRWTGREGAPVTPLAVDGGEFTAWVHGAPGRVYAALTVHTAPDVDRSRVLAIDAATGRVVARSAWLPVAALSLTYEPTTRALLALAPAGRAWRLATPTLRAQPLSIDLRATQERRMLAPTSDGYLAGGFDTARQRFAPYSIQGSAPDGSLLLISTATPSIGARWRPRAALPGVVEPAARPGDGAAHAVALGPNGALVVYHPTRQVVGVVALP